MAFPASQLLLAGALSTAKDQANSTKQFCNGVSVASAAGSIERGQLIACLRVLTVAVNQWNATKALAGIAQYARDQYDDQGLDVVTEFNAMVAAATGLRDWIVANFPTDAGSGAWLSHSYGTDGVPVALLFTTAQLAQFRTEVATFTSTIS